jgi:integrase
MGRKYQDLTDDRIDAAIDFEMKGIIWDKQVRGLRLYIGARKVSWQFYSDTRDHGSKSHRFKTLGRYDRGGFASVVGGGPAPPAVIKTYTGPRPTLRRESWHMGVAEARKAALVELGDMHKGTAAPNPRSGIRFREAFDAYVLYLERKAADNGKPARWAKGVSKLGRKYMLPKWGEWTLTQMSESPGEVADWVRGIGAVSSANHCARLLRAIYRYRTKRDLTLSKVNLPTAAVEMRKEKMEQKGITAETFPAWWKAWQKIGSPVHRAYHLTNLLTGARPGELARCRWNDIDEASGTLTIGDAKAGNNIAIPITPEIRYALKLAADAAPDREPEDVIFPGCLQAGHRDLLPARGHALRRTYKTIAATHCGIPDDVSAFLLGHVPEGMSQRYLLRWALSSGPVFKEAQAKVSKEMMRLLLKGRKPALALVAQRAICLEA